MSCFNLFSRVIRLNRILLAGATGALGRHVHRQLLQRGDQVRPLLRSAHLDLLDPRSLAGVCEGMDAVVSCAGASMDIANRCRRSYRDVDWLGNRNLLAEARSASVRKFVYVSLYGAGRLRHTEYAKAHERFVEELQRSGIPHTIVRPTGFFHSFCQILGMARKGHGIVIGDGSARTNPIHESDVAGACVEAIATTKSELEVGGPDILTRQEIVELALDAAQRRAKATHVPPLVVRSLLPLVGLANPRLRDLVAFAAEVSLIDCIAPVYGRQRLGDYFRRQPQGDRIAVY